MMARSSFLSGVISELDDIVVLASGLVAMNDAAKLLDSDCPVKMHGVYFFVLGIFNILVFYLP